MPQIWNGLQEDIREIGNKLSVISERFPFNFQDAINNLAATLSSYVGDLIGSIGSPTIEAVGNFAKQVPTIVIAVVMALLSSYFFVAEKHTITQFVDNYMPESLQSRFLLMKRSITRAIGGYLKAQLKIELWMYLLLVIGFSILQIDYTLLIALGVAFLDLLPFFHIVQIHYI